jgi:osmotically inducible protein OsmC
MAVRTAEAVWEGTITEGSGNITVANKSFPYSFSSRFEEGNGSNPEELLGAAHAGCFSMQLGALLGRAGFPANEVRTVAKVHLIKGDAGFSITKIDLVTEADVPNIDEATFLETAKNAKEVCPVSRALASIEITLDAKLV